MLNFTPMFDELLLDNRFLELVILLKNRHQAMGMCWEACRLANRYWLDNESPMSLIPFAAFENCNLLPLLDVNLAIKKDDGYYMRGISKVANYRIDRIYNKSVAASIAGKHSAEVRKTKYGTSIPQNASNNPNENRTKTERNRTLRTPPNETELSKDKISKDNTSLSEVYSDDVISIVNNLITYMRQNNVKVKIPIMLVKWYKEAEKMMRLDKRDISEINKVIVWCQTNQFWRSNILSIPKLREKYDTLLLQMNRNTFTKEIDKPINGDLKRI